MGEYSNSQSTRMALIEAAGELFAEYGYAAVTTREIAKSACENIGSIHYHFGGKDGLLAAVIEFAIQPWKSNPLGSYLRENEKLFETKEGQKELVSGVIDLLFAKIFADGQSSWPATFIFQTLQRDNLGADIILKDASNPARDAFIEIYKRITGDECFEHAHAWFHSTASAVFLLSIMPSAPGKSFPDKKLPPTYLDSLKGFSKRSALSTLGLTE